MKNIPISLELLPQKRANGRAINMINIPQPGGKQKSQPPSLDKTNTAQSAASGSWAITRVTGNRHPLSQESYRGPPLAGGNFEGTELDRREPSEETGIEAARAGDGSFAIKSTRGSFCAATIAGEK